MKSPCCLCVSVSSSHQLCASLLEGGGTFPRRVTKWIKQTDVILGLLISGFRNVVYRQLVGSLDGGSPFARPPATYTGEHKHKKADIYIYISMSPVNSNL
jgi:hypothetical protein